MKRYGMGWPVFHRVTTGFCRQVIVLLFGMAGLGLGGVALADDFREGMALYDSGRYAEAFEFIRKAAEADNPDAQYRLSSMYWHGRGVDVNYEAAFLWVRRSAFQDHVKAAYALSDMYRKGIVDDDSYQAYYWFRRAAELDMENGRLAMALMYYRGTVTEKNMDKALKWFHKAAEDGNVTALTMLGIMYENGEQVEKDEAMALALFTEAAGKDVEKLTYRKAALESRSEAQYHLGRMIKEGRGGVAADNDIALSWYRKAAEGGNRAAQARLDAQRALPGKE